MTLKELALELNTSKKTLKQLCSFQNEQDVSLEEELNARTSWAKRKNQKQMPIKDRIYFEKSKCTFTPKSKKSNNFQNKFDNGYDYEKAETLETVIILFCKGLTNSQIAFEIATNKKYKNIKDLSSDEINQILISHGHRPNKIIDKKHNWSKISS